MILPDIGTSEYARLAARFWSKVDMSGGDSACWPWIGARFAKRGGYGAFSKDNGAVAAHRISYALSGREAGPGVFICHRCDNPPCVNPAHLFAGDAKANCADMWAKGRDNHACGADAAWAKLDDDMARDAYARVKAGAGIRETAREMGITHTTVGAIVRGESWRHLGLTPIRRRPARLLAGRGV